MKEPVLRAVYTAESQNSFITQAQLDALGSASAEARSRVDALKLIGNYASSIVKEAARALFAENPQLLAPGGNAYGHRKLAACLRDLEIFLRYISYALLVGESSPLEERCLNGLRDTYIALGVPISSTVIGVQRMKQITLQLLNDPNRLSFDRDINQEYSIPEIRSRYPKQWVTIEVTKSINGFPAAGVLKDYDHNADSLADKVSHLNGNSIYTFFTNQVNEQPEPLERKNQYQGAEEISVKILKELELYFDTVVMSIT